MPGTTRVEIRTLKVGRYVAIDEDAYKILEHLEVQAWQAR